MKDKNHTPMTKQQKIDQHLGSRFIRVIPSHQYASYLKNVPAREYDAQGRRTK